MTGFNSPKVSDRNATAVVRAAKKHGANIWSYPSIIAFLKFFSFLISFIFTKRCTVNEIVKIKSKAIKFEDTTLIFQSIKPRNPAVIKVAKKAFSNGNNTYHMEPKNKYNISANITATAVPKITKSDSI